MKLRYTILTLITYVLIALSCNDNSTSTEPPPPPENPNLVSEDIGTDGGEITSKDGALTLTMPAGALGNTETITIEEISPDELGSEFDSVDAENAWELGPDGLTFDQPITARFQTDQNPVPDDTTLAVVPEMLLVSDGETVEPLDSLRVEADADEGTVMVSGQLTHFSILANYTLSRFGVEFLVFKVPDAIPFGRSFKPIANLLDSDNQIIDDPPFYRDFSTQPVKLNGDNKSIAMKEHGLIENAYTISLDYTCTDMGTGEFDAFTFVRGAQFLDGEVLDVSKAVKCVKGGTLEGRVTLNGEGVANIVVFIGRDVVQETTTDAEGNYRFENVLPGEREIFIDLRTIPEGAQCYENPKTVTVETNETTRADFECVTEGNETASVTVEEFTAEDQGDLMVQASWCVRYMVSGDQPLKCSINWGDGSEEEEVDCGKMSEEDNEVRTGTADHTYQDVGNFILQLRAEIPNLDFSDTDETEVVVKEPKEFTLTVSTSGTGSGVVTSNPEGINTTEQDPDEESYMEGTQVELTASSDGGSIFTGWSGDIGGGEGCDGTGDCTVPMNEVRTVTASFSSESSTGDAMETGLFALALTGDFEALLVLGERNSQLDTKNRNPSISQQNEVQFGDLTGTFPVAIAGANGFIVIDLLTREVLLDETGFAGTGPFFGVAGVTQSPGGPDSPAVLEAFGQNGSVSTRFDKFGAVAGSDPTFDIFPAGGNVVSNVMTQVRPLREVGFWVYDANQGIYVTAESGAEFDDSLFEGELVSAYMHDDRLSDNPVPQPRGPMLVLTRGTESKLYLGTWEPIEATEVVADLGNDARKIRCADDGTGNLICAVSVFGDDRLAILTWDGETEPTLQGFVDVGDGPVGIDLRLLGNGNIGVVSTGFNDNTVTVTELSPNGSVVGNNTRPVLEGCQSPGHAIFIQDAESLKIVGTCFNSNNYVIMESEL